MFNTTPWIKATALLALTATMTGCCFWGPAMTSSQQQWVKTSLLAESQENADAACTKELASLFDACEKAPGARYSNHAQAIVSPEACWKPKFDACMAKRGWEQQYVERQTCPGMKLF
ncbi:hypothetical protein [Variovorax sp. GB1P17]|uniref:hypothetical protein n=1 Tax=Variovorax sp. GB1P17 TaxID=3443740 RepID=UPI003F485B9F